MCIRDSPAGQRRENAGAGDREEHHHPEPLAAVRGTEAVSYTHLIQHSVAHLYGVIHLGAGTAFGAVLKQEVALVLLTEQLDQICTCLLYTSGEPRSNAHC